MVTMQQGSPVPPSVGPYDAGRLASDLAARTLQAQARELAQRIQGAVTQRQELVGQLSQASGVRIVTLNGQIAQVDGTIAQLQATLAAINDRIAQIQLSNRPQIIVSPPRFPRFPMSPRDVQILSIFSVVFVCGVLMPIVFGFVRRLMRGSPQPTQAVADPAMNARMDRLEQAIDTIAIEIERISEGQRFVTKVLTQRPAQSPPAAVDASAESAPFLALGAGPLEPIRHGERQTMRQSITPH